MVHTTLSIIGILGSFYLLKYRQQVGDMLGEAEWMKSVGGIYGVVIFVSIALFFWSIAELTNTTDILFGPLKSIIPSFGINQPSQI